MRKGKLSHWLPDLQKAVRLEQFNFYEFHSKLYFTVHLEHVIKKTDMEGRGEDLRSMDNTQVLNTYPGKRTPERTTLASGHR
ncbi:hypothetical protein OS493_000854 [Desmophyllum pertusum]|uniref:Uncharacterized protein n=1 Tax=Desmophyllum pertusum TaxID=174260 RepID=A0A9X0D6L6_9CNID|nr:hypothetical protein OS493_000854 [Desmophyllum pertusum]